MVTRSAHVSQHINGMLLCDIDISPVKRWTIAFCPYFFDSDKLKYLEERTNGEKKSFAYIGSLDTYERVFAHELMHNDVIGFSPEHSKLIGLDWTW
jgi:hypothetical protein